MATIANVQASKYGSSATASVTVSWASTPTAGNLLIARTRNLGGSGTEKGSISGWTLVEYALYGAGNRFVSIFYKIAGSSEGDVTYSSTASTETYLVIEEWSNSDGWDATPEDQYTNVDTTGSVVTSRSTGTTGTTTVADELAVSVLGCGSTVTGISWSNSFTASFEQPTGALTFAGGHKTLSATGTVETTASWTTSRVAGAAIATFKGVNAISGVLSQTQASDTVSATGTLALAGVVTQTQAADSLSSSATLSLSGVLAQSQAGDSLAATGTLSLSGVLSQTQAGDALSSSATLALAGVVSQSQADDTLSSTATLEIAAVVNQTQVGDTLSSASTLAIVGTLSQIQADDSLSATGAGAVSISGELLQTQAGDTLTSTAALSISGLLSQTQAGDSLVSSGTISITGVLSITQEAQTATGSGTITSLITGYGNLEIIKAARLSTIYPDPLENIKAARNATIEAQAIETIKAPRIQNIDR